MLCKNEKTGVDLLTHCNFLIQLLDEECPNQRNYPGTIRSIAARTINVIQAVKNGQIEKPKFNVSSLSRMFVDDNNDFQSPVLKEIVAIGELVDLYWD